MSKFSEQIQWLGEFDCHDINATPTEGTMSHGIPEPSEFAGEFTVDVESDQPTILVDQDETTLQNLSSRELADLVKMKSDWTVDRLAFLIRLAADRVQDQDPKLSFGAKCLLSAATTKLFKLAQ